MTTLSVHLFDKEETMREELAPELELETRMRHANGGSHTHLGWLP
jgi:hypothetical protein